MPKIAPKLASKPTIATPTPTPERTTTSTTASSPTALSPPPAPAPTSEPSWLTGPALKAANEHTYATQRAKKAADRAKTKVPPRKASSAVTGGGGGPALSSSPSRSAAVTALWAEVWDARKIVSAEDVDWPELSNWSSPSPAECAALRPTQDREVPLSALVRPVKPKGAKAKAARGTFSPHV